MWQAGRQAGREGGREGVAGRGLHMPGTMEIKTGQATTPHVSTPQ